MTATYIVNGAIVAAALTILGGLKLLRHPLMARQARHLGYAETSFARIGAVELAGAAGVVAGVWWAPLGVAAASGVVALLVLAVHAHLRAGDPPRRALGALWLAALAVLVAVSGALR